MKLQNGLDNNKFFLEVRIIKKTWMESKHKFGQMFQKKQ